MVRKMSGPEAHSATALAAEVWVPQTTLSRWKREYGRLPGRTEGSMGRRGSSPAGGNTTHNLPSRPGKQMDFTELQRGLIQ